MSNIDASTTDAMTDDTPGRFPSLASLRAAHSELLRRHREIGSTPEFLDEVENFIQRGQATGALLDAGDDRWDCQSLLGYWITTLYQAGGELLDVTLAEFDPALAPELDDADCPYLGLDAFREAHHEVFFGRQRLVDDTISQLKEGRLLAVVGPSGSGKSSAVMAGLLPALKAGAVSGSQSWRYAPPMVPGSNPLTKLTRLFWRGRADAVELIQRQAKRFRQDSDHLARRIGTLSEGPVALVIDQFEEVFTLCNDDHIRQAFIDNLLGLLQTTDVRHTVILTMRIDFEPHLVRFPKFRSLFEEAQVRVTPLSAGELREAIEGPARLVGLRFEEGVVDTLLQDILGEPAALPLLQFTLLKLWETRERNRVTWEAYQRLGGGRQSLAHSADEFYEGLIPEEQMTAKRILLRMVRPGEGLEVTSNRVRRETLYHAGEARDRIDRVLGKLIEARLVRLTEGETPADTQVEVAHEALVRNWPRLVDWLEDERETMRRRLRLTAAAEQWEALGKDPEALRRGALLEEALRFEGLSELEAEFVQASQAAVEQVEREKEAARQRELEQVYALVQAERKRARERDRAARRLHRLAEEEAKTARHMRQLAKERAKTAKRLRRLVMALVVMFLLAVGAAQIARTQQQMAQVNEQLADIRGAEAMEARDVATSRLLAAQAIASLKSTPQLSLLLAIEAVNLSRTVQADDALRQALQASRGWAVLRGHADRVNALAFSPNGKWLATGSQDNRARVWETATGSEVSQSIHGGEVLAVAFSLDGRWVATGTRNGEVWVWEADTGASVARMYPQGEVLAVVFSPDGRWVVSADGCPGLEPCSAAVHVWEPSSGREVARMEHQDSVNALAFSPDGQWVVTGSRDGTARVWEVETGAEVAILSGHRSGINDVGFDPGGTWIAAASADGTTRLWNTMNLTGEPVVLYGHEDKVSVVAFDGSGQRLVTASADGTARLWDMSDPGAATSVLRGHEKEIKDLAFDPNGEKLATGSADGTVRLWDVLSGTSETVLEGHTASVNVVVFSPDGALLATGSSDSSIRLWATTGSKAQIVLRQHEGSVMSVALNHDGSLLASSGSDGTIRLWDVSTALDTGDAAEVAVLYAQEERIYKPIYGVAFGPDGRLLAATVETNATGADGVETVGEIRLWNVSTALDEGSVVRVATLHIPEEPSFGVALSPDGSLLASTGYHGTVRLWDVSTVLDTGDAEEVAILRAPDEHIYDVAFSPPDGRLLATSGGSGLAVGAVRLWDVSTALYAGDSKAEVAAIRGDASFVFLAFSPDGQTLASGSFDSTVRFWDVSKAVETSGSDAEIAVLRGHEDLVAGLAFGPDGRLLSTGSQDGTTRLWDVSKAMGTGGSDAEIAVLRGHEGLIYREAFDFDGNLLVTGGEDGTVRLWTIRIEDLLQEACSRAVRNLTQGEWETYFGRKEPYRQTCQGLPAHPSVADAALAQGLEYAREGEIDRALDFLHDAVELDPKIELRWALDLAEAYNEVCRQGGSQRLVEKVLPACKRAVELAVEADDALLSYRICLNRGIDGLSEIVLPACQYVKGLVKPITFGQTVAGVVEAGGRYIWTFEGTAGQTVTIAMDEDGYGLDTYLTLLGPDGMVLIENDDGGGGNNALISGFLLPEAGIYTIITRGYSDYSTGAYTLTLIETGP